METLNYTLREVQDSDINFIHQGLSNPKVTAFYDVHFPTIEATQEQMDWYANLRKEGTGIWWCVFNKENNEFCGAGGYNSWDQEHRKAEIGFWLLPEYWGKGVMKEVMPRIFEAGFLELGMNRIEGYVVSGNVKCKRALEKINFSYEGTMRECEYKNGEAISVDVYSILKSEWK